MSQRRFQRTVDRKEYSLPSPRFRLLNVKYPVWHEGEKCTVTVEKVTRVACKTIDVRTRARARTHTRHTHTHTHSKQTAISYKQQASATRGEMNVGAEELQTASVAHAAGCRPSVGLRCPAVDTEAEAADIREQVTRFVVDGEKFRSVNE